VVHLTTFEFVTPISFRGEPETTLIAPKFPVMLPLVLNFVLIFDRFEIANVIGINNTGNFG
jgi:hypothetical protein